MMTISNWSGLSFRYGSGVSNNEKRLHRCTVSGKSFEAIAGRACGMYFITVNLADASVKSETYGVHGVTVFCVSCKARRAR